MPDFAIRTLLPEKMDQPGVPAQETRQALRELETINRWLGGYHVIFNALERLDWSGNRAKRIIDLGSGGGDLLRAIANWAIRKKRKVDLIGVDWNPVMTEYARQESSVFPNIHFETMSVFDDRLLKHEADITMSSLFCHHFDNEQLIGLLQRMRELSSQAVIINDIHRHWFAYYAIKAITVLFSRTYLVKYDAPLSVARSLTRKEWEDVLSAAGFEHYSLRWMWAWRWQLIMQKT